ncbi:MAG TPA: four-helix bundle copper-binding protein [Gemmataceae bacterium]|nr:four-helix bundle copper-binding protein [Gemmataceae bacterium]
MRHLRLAGAFAVVLGLTALLGLMARGQDQPTGKQPAVTPHKHDKHFQHCAKICADCMVRCEANFRHCAHLVAAGKKEHVRGMHLSADCAELCAVASKLAARQSELAAITCETCARACLACAAECGKHADQEMNACALVCHECARVCNEMVKHVRQSGEAPAKPK